MSASERQDDGAEESTGVRHRSPNYPAISLEKAVERVEKLNAKYKRAQVPVSVAIDFWGYKPNSSSGGQCVAALKAYGLLNVEGEGKGRKIWVSETAFRILMNSIDRTDLLRKAALSPSIHQELWEKYREHGVPADEIIEHYLLLDREKGTFNQDAVGTAVANFRASLKYAGLLGDDKTADGESQPETTAVTVVPPGFWSLETPVRSGPLPRTQGPVAAESVRPPSRRAGMAGASSEVGHREDVFTVEHGAVVVQWPERMSPEEIEDFEGWMQILIRKVKRSVKSDPPAGTDD